MKNFYLLYFFIILFGCKTDSKKTQPKLPEKSPNVEKKISETPVKKPKGNPPIEKGVFKNSELVELIKLDSTIKLDIRYATPNNFVGEKVYNQARAFLQKEAAIQLVKAHQSLKKDGYGIVIFDGYRPWSVTKIFWMKTPKSKKSFVANPKKGSKHNRGCAVDISLYELKTGKNVDMPTDFDSFEKSAYPNYSGGTENSRKLRNLLIARMAQFKFTVEENEWWHYNFYDWKSYKIENIQFEDL